MSNADGRMQRRAELNVSVAINAKGGDCWQIKWIECSDG